MWPWRASPQPTSTPIAPRWSRSSRLLARFSSAVPQVIATGGSPGSVEVASTEATKPVTRSKWAKPDSCGSSSGVKKEPDCRKRPPKVPGRSHSACSAASAPRLAPMMVGFPTVRYAVSTVGSTCSVSASA